MTSTRFSRRAFLASLIAAAAAGGARPPVGLPSWTVFTDRKPPDPSYFDKLPPLFFEVFNARLDKMIEYRLGNMAEVFEAIRQQ